MNAAGTEQLERSSIAAGDSLENIELIQGTGFDDSLTGNAGDNIVSGGSGADLIDGGAGSDAATYTKSAAGVRIDLLAGTAAGAMPTATV